MTLYLLVCLRVNHCILLGRVSADSPYRATTMCGVYAMMYNLATLLVGTTSS